VSCLICSSLYSYGAHQDLHSFPTRRSSDLAATTAVASSSCFPTIARVGSGIAATVPVPTAASGPKTSLAASPAICWRRRCSASRSEEHTSELQSLTNLVCRLLLEKKNN